jgi:hypothetical protein
MVNSIEEKIEKMSLPIRKKFFENVRGCEEDEDWCNLHKSHGVDYFNPNKNIISNLVYQEMFEGKNILEPGSYNLD